MGLCVFCGHVCVCVCGSMIALEEFNISVHHAGVLRDSEMASGRCLDETTESRNSINNERRLM